MLNNFNLLNEINYFNLFFNYFYYKLYFQYKWKCQCKSVNEFHNVLVFDLSSYCKTQLHELYKIV